MPRVDFRNDLKMLEEEVLHLGDMVEEAIDLASTRW